MDREIIVYFKKQRNWYCYRYRIDKQNMQQGGKEGWIQIMMTLRTVLWNLTFAPGEVEFMEIFNQIWDNISIFNLGEPFRSKMEKLLENKFTNFRETHTREYHSIQNEDEKGLNEKEGGTRAD